MPKKETNAIHLKEYGIPVIFRHDYNKNSEGDNISEYIGKSCKALEKFIENLPNASQFKNFWDIGCGNDQAVSHFIGLGYNGIGVDKYPASNSKLIKKSDFYKDLPKLAKKYGNPDIVFCNHTLEHSLAPLLLEQITNVQNIGGALFIAVPDADYPWAYNITQSTSHWSIFNEGFLRTLLQRFGYEVCVEKRCFRENCGELFAFAIKRWNP